MQRDVTFEEWMIYAAWRVEQMDTACKVDMQVNDG